MFSYSFRPGTNCRYVHGLEDWYKVLVSTRSPREYSTLNICSRTTVEDAQTKGGFQWGYALPETPTGSNDEYIGLLVRPAMLMLNFAAYTPRLVPFNRVRKVGLASAMAEECPIRFS